MVSILKRIRRRLFRTNKWPSPTLDEIRKRAKILVIDDSEFAYLKLFRKDSYTIEKWNDIDDLQKIESGYYDIILLDIHGVGKEQSKEEGFGILKYLQKVSPTQIIVAYSEADFSLKFHEFFQRADAVLAKSSDYVDFKKVVDDLLTKRFSLGFYLEKIATITNKYGVDQEKVRELATNAILTQKSSRLESYLEGFIENKDLITMTLQIVQVAIGIGSLWK